MNKVHHNGSREMVRGVLSRLHVVNTIPNKINSEPLTGLPQ